MTQIEQELQLEHCQDEDVLEYAIDKCIALIKIGCDVTAHRKLLTRLKSKLTILRRDIIITEQQK